VPGNPPFILAFTFAGSVVCKSQLVAGLLGLGTIFGGVVVNFIAKAYGISRYFPYSIGDMAVELINGTIYQVEVVLAVVCALAVAFILTAYSYNRFARFEL